MTTPSLQFHPKLLLPVILLVILAAAAEEQQRPMTRPGCPEMCGNISIPFPFGIGLGCFRGGFEVLCNHSFVPSRAFLAGRETNQVADFSTVMSNEYQISWSRLELVSISVATGEAQAYAPVVYDCKTDDLGKLFFFRVVDMNFSGTPFAASATRNVLIGVGLDVEPEMTYQPRPDIPNYTPLSCQARDYLETQTARNGSCEGRGCCQATAAPDHFIGKDFGLGVNNDRSSRRWEIHPCNYGMLVEKSWYNFSTLDMEGNKTLLKRFPRGVHLALDFAAGNASCPAKGQPDYACVSGNSSFANAPNRLGYICKCWEHYDGNPYVPNGCQDIDECLENPCSNGGICKNKLQGYDCPCKSGMREDGKGGTCTHVFTTAAKATVGAIGGILLIAVISFLVILHKEKKKTEEFYIKNGGPNY